MHIPATHVAGYELASLRDFTVRAKLKKPRSGERGFSLTANR